MADISDDQLRAELKELTGKDAGPIMQSTRPALIKKLMRLKESQKSNAKSTSKLSSSSTKASKPSGGRKSAVATAPSTSFGFSSDEDLEWDKDTRANNKKEPKKKTNVGRKPTGAKQVVTQSKVVSLSSSTSVQNGAADGTRKGKHASRRNEHSEEQLMALSNVEIQEQLLQITGTRFPITDATRNALIKKLRNILAGGDSISISASALSKKKESVNEPMETHFSEDDDVEEEMMDFDPTPPEVTSSVIGKPKLVSQSVNTSSFLDVTDTPDIDPDCIVMPAPPRHSVVSKHNETRITSTTRDRDSPLVDITSQLPSPNLSSTRRSFVPSSAVVADPVFPRPMPPSPPRSTYARRPLRTSPTNFISLNKDVTPKPTTRLSGHMDPFGSGKPVPVSRSDYTTRYNTGQGRVIDTDLKRDKVAKDVDMLVREKGKPSSHLYSKALVLLLLSFLVAVAGVYIYGRLTAPVQLEKAFQPQDNYEFLLSTEENQFSCTECVTAGQLAEASSLVQSLKRYLGDHAGWFECKKPGFAERGVPAVVAKKAMDDLHGNEAYYTWNTAIWLIMKNPHWHIRFYGEDKTSAVVRPTDVWRLEAVEANRPLSCVLAHAMTRIVTVVIALIVVAILGYVAFHYGRYRKRYAEEQEEFMYDTIESIIDLLKAQQLLSRENSMEKPYLAISHVHDTIIAPQDRQRMKGVWEKAVKFIRDKETRVREEVQQVQGEEFRVWRWLQLIESPVVKGKVWQGSALGGATKLKFQPTQFLKIRGMFDVYSEIGNDWPRQIEDAILEKLGERHGVVHIAVDTDSDENRVYVKFESNKRAGKAFETLNGAYFGGECVNCKFMTATKYHQKFPHAQHATTCLKPSNTLKLSLQGRPTSSSLYPSLDQYR